MGYHLQITTLGQWVVGAEAIILMVQLPKRVEGAISFLVALVALAAVAVVVHFLAEVSPTLALVG
jgi:hypothetical protein